MSRDLSAKGFALWRSAMRWQRGVDAALRPLGLTHTRYLVLLDRGPHGTDARLWRVIVTSEGNRVLRRARTVVDDASTVFFRQNSSQ